LYKQDEGREEREKRKRGPLSLPLFFSFCLSAMLNRKGVEQQQEVFLSISLQC
jgi:hypothetical protein